MAPSPAARPSSPSVRFTELEVPETTRATKITYAQGTKDATHPSKKGTMVQVAGTGEMGWEIRNHPRRSPKPSCPIIL
jgi:hypothetical protein